MKKIFSFRSGGQSQQFVIWTNINVWPLKNARTHAILLFRRTDEWLRMVQELTSHPTKLRQRALHVQHFLTSLRPLMMIQERTFLTFWQMDRWRRQGTGSKNFGSLMLWLIYCGGELCKLWAEVGAVSSPMSHHRSRRHFESWKQTIMVGGGDVIPNFLLNTFVWYLLVQRKCLAHLQWIKGKHKLISQS